MVETRPSKEVVATRPVGRAGESFDTSVRRTGHRARNYRDRATSAWVWLNLVCLDAPLVAIGWQWLFAQTFGLAVVAPERWALFLTAWLIYLADRFGDSLRVNLRGPTSLRQRFCLRHRFGWLIAGGSIVVADLFVIFAWLDAATLRLGAQVGGFALVYLVVNQAAPRVWRTLPAKEIIIGTLFAAGTMVGLAEDLPTAALVPWILFAGLCSLNCISIAVWERELDEAQQRISIATAFPAIRHYLLPALVFLAAIGFAFALSERGGRTVLVCVGASAALLAALHIFRNKIQGDIRTALADLVLLTPLLVLALAFA